MTETALSRGIQDALRALGVMVVRVQAGTFRGAGAHHVQGATPGTPDLWWCWRGAQGWLEVKAPGGALSAVQEQWHLDARRNGASVVVVRSVEQALRVVRHATETPAEFGKRMGWAEAGGDE